MAVSLLASSLQHDAVSGTAAERLVEEKARINAVQQALLAELGKIGLAEHCPGITAAFDAAEIRIDPFDQSESLQCYWKTPLGMNQGTVQLLPDDQLFAEYDVLCVHPDKPAWFVEAVTAWGQASTLKTELRLIPVP